MYLSPIPSKSGLKTRYRKTKENIVVFRSRLFKAIQFISFKFYGIDFASGLIDFHILICAQLLHLLPSVLTMTLFRKNTMIALGVPLASLTRRWDAIYRISVIYSVYPAFLFIVFEYPMKWHRFMFHHPWSRACLSGIDFLDHQEWSFFFCLCLITSLFFEEVPLLLSGVRDWISDLHKPFHPRWSNWGGRGAKDRDLQAENHNRWGAKRS